MTPEHVYAVAYEALGMRAWVFPNVSDLPMMFVTKKYYPNFPDAISIDDIPPETRDTMKVQPYQEQIDLAREIIKGWEGNRVQMGLGIGKVENVDASAVCGEALSYSSADSPAGAYQKADCSPLFRTAELVCTSTSSFDALTGELVMECELCRVPFV